MQSYIISDNIISPLGFTTSDNFKEVIKGHSGISLVDDPLLSPAPVYAARIADTYISDKIDDDGYTRFEKLCILSVKDALLRSGLRGDEKETIFILSTTKGNIDLIQSGHSDADIIEQVSLHHTARDIAAYFDMSEKPLVVSNACISGVLAIIIAKRLLASGQYKNAVVCGADVLSRFVVSGFQSLMAISDEPCRPFDKERKGINLGEGAATVVMTTNKDLLNENSISVLGEGVTNDANHISGPSRTGAELADAVSKAIQRSGISVSELSFVSAHGTATLYNDEMESKAFATAALSDVPLHSLKGQFGHTLGAAGVIESIMTIESLRRSFILPSLNYTSSGVPMPLNINTSVIKSDKTHALKTASGFGGCNAALLFLL
jgi:3-oxoacyl-[acyl-carrier-protein] synthase-1